MQTVAEVLAQLDSIARPARPVSSGPVVGYPELRWLVKYGTDAERAAATAELDRRAARNAAAAAESRALCTLV